MPMKHFKKIGLVLLAGAISFVIFCILFFGLFALVELFKEEQMLEPRLIANSFLKLVGLVFVGSWLWFSGKFLSKEKLKSRGRKALYIYFAISIFAYVSSFLITPRATLNQNLTQQQIPTERSTEFLDDLYLEQGISKEQVTTVMSKEWPRLEIRAVGKNLISMASFYNVCANKKLISRNIKAIRWASFMGSKYLIIAGIGKEEKTWIENGAKGVLIYAPETSEDVFQANFSHDACNAIKKSLDTNYEILDHFISKVD